MRKIAVVITARPSYSRVKTLLKAINNSDKLQLQLIVAGSALLDKYGNSIEYIVKDGFNINEQVFIVIEGENPTTMAKTTGLAILEFATLLNNLKPDAVIVIADRYETLAVSIAAAYQNIPLVHIQGGEITGNIDEKVRHANTKLADIHFASTDLSRERLIKMGEDPNYVFNTGCPSIDLAKEAIEKPELDFDIVKKYGGVGANINLKDDYIVVMQHPVTTSYSEARKQITATLEAIVELNMQTLWFWPNVDAGSDGTSKGIRAFREKHNPKYIRFFKNLEPLDFLRVLNKSNCLVGNSSVGIRECSFLGLPVVNIGDRQNQRERGNNVIDVDYNQGDIFSAVKKQIDNERYRGTIYGDGTAGKKISDILEIIELKFHKTLNYK